MTYQFHIKDYANWSTYDLLEMLTKLDTQIAIHSGDIQGMRYHSLISDEIEKRIEKRIENERHSRIFW